MNHKNITFEKQSPRKLWEVDAIFRCPVVGACMTMAEQKQILKKSGVPYKRKSDYDIHEFMVMSAESEGPVSRRAQNLLNRKYGREAADRMALDEAAFTAYFQNALKNDDFRAALWAAAIHPGLSDSARREIFGGIHMTMHANSEDILRLKQEASDRKNEISGLRQKDKEKARHIKALSGEIEALKNENRKLEKALAAANDEKAPANRRSAEKRDPQPSKNALQENKQLAETNRRLAQRINEAEDRVERLKMENRRLASERDRYRQAALAISEKTANAAVQLSEMNPCDPDCPSFEFCRKRVLMVGGITKIKAQYRKLVEESGAEFDYHDGYLKSGVKNLESRLRRADVVICPVNCNSHAACSLVKNLAKKHEKPFFMLSGSSLSAVSQALQGEAAA